MILVTSTPIRQKKSKHEEKAEIKCVCIYVKERERERERGTGTTCGSLGLHIICVGGVENAAVPNMHSTCRKGVNSE